MSARRQALLGMMLAFAFSPVQAVTEAERLLKQDIDRREQERREQRWEEAHTPGAAPAVAPAPAPAARSAGPCFPVRRILLHPAGVLSAPRVRAILSPYEGRCLNAGDLAALQQALNAQALAQGLVTTRTVVPEQNLAAGELRLEVWPGRVEALRASGLSARELAFATPVRAGDRLQLRALEQTIDNLNRLGSFDASLDLQPGAQPGGSIADVRVQRSAPWQAGLSWQGEALNGAETHALRASLTLDSPFGLVDRLNLGVNGNLQDGQVDDARGGSVDYDLPFGWWRASVGADRFDYRNPVQAGLTSFTASGKSRAWRAELARSLYRDATRRISLGLHGKQRLSDNFIDGVTLGVSTSRLRATGLRLDFSRVAAPWVWDASLDAEHGRGRSPALYSPLDAEYVRVLGNTRAQYYLGAASVSASLSWQWSDARLAPSEQFALSGHVQGFSPRGLNADSAAALQLEFVRPVAVQRAGVSAVRPSLGLSWALAPHAGGNPRREELAAVTTALAVPWRKAVANVGVAWPIPQINTLEAPQGWQLDASFSLQW
ncbi:MAG: ShlB/FhaC/HecB family hemolysin secretion/activation protein [Pseudomonadota bacterium]